MCIPIVFAMRNSCHFIHSAPGSLNHKTDRDRGINLSTSAAQIPTVHSRRLPEFNVEYVVVFPRVAQAIPTHKRIETFVGLKAADTISGVTICTRISLLPFVTNTILSAKRFELRWRGEES